MFLKFVDLTTALRPSLLPDETLLFVQDAVGLYNGKVKVPYQQDGHVYLTTHRICYVDDAEPRKFSTAIDLKDLDHGELYAGFLKSSPKITLIPRSSLSSQKQQASDVKEDANIGPEFPPGPDATKLRPASISSSSSSPALRSRNTHNYSWICRICSFSNALPTTFEPTSMNSDTPIPACNACGIKPTRAHILKAAVATASGRLAPQDMPLPQYDPQRYQDAQMPGLDDFSSSLPPSTIQCPRCTFLNHVSIKYCEICGALLHTSPERPSLDVRRSSSVERESKVAAKGAHSEWDNTRLSFRAGGEKQFYEKLKGALVQKKWLLKTAPPIPEPMPEGLTEDSFSQNAQNIGREERRSASAGIAGLERRGLHIRKKNEAMIGSAFEDLDALMASTKEIIELAEAFAQNSSVSHGPDASQIIAETAKGLEMVTTKDMLGKSSGSEALYLAELARNLAEFLTDDTKGVLKKEGGVMTLVDLWAMFNRARDGVELIGPPDFEKAARLWERLKLPVRLRQFKNGLLVVQQAERSDDKTIAQLLSWLQETHAPPKESSLNLRVDFETFGAGITPQDAAQHFGWSVGVAIEELEMAEEKGALCREEGREGLRFWENWLVDHQDHHVHNEPVVDETGVAKHTMGDIVSNMKATGLL